MSKMIKLTDELGAVLEEWAEKDSATLAGEIRLLLDYRRHADAQSSLVEAIGAKIDARLDELKALIENTTVDRVNNGGPILAATPGAVKVYVPWDVAHELLYEFLPEDAPEFIGNASEAMRQADSEFPVFIIDNKLWTEDFYGTKSPILNISPRVTQFLKEANVAEH